MAAKVKVAARLRPFINTEHPDNVLLFLHRRFPFLLPISATPANASNSHSHHVMISPLRRTRFLRRTLNHWWTCLQRTSVRDRFHHLFPCLSRLCFWEALLIRTALLSCTVFCLWVTSFWKDPYHPRQCLGAWYHSTSREGRPIDTVPYH